MDIPTTGFCLDSYIFSTQLLQSADATDAVFVTKALVLSKWNYSCMITALLPFIICNNYLLINNLLQWQIFWPYLDELEEPEYNSHILTSMIKALV